VELSTVAMPITVHDLSVKIKISQMLLVNTGGPR